MQGPLKIAAKTNPKALAWVLYSLIKENQQEIEMIGVGAGAVNAAVKAAIIARSLLAAQGKDITVTPAFVPVTLDSGEKTDMTGIRFVVRAKAS